jgi:hypothetical protein
MALESPVQRDGDMGFMGFASRLNPLTLPAGMLQDSVNMRLDRGVAQTRKGAKRLADDVDTSAVAPLTVPFTLGTDQTVGAGDMTFSVSTVTVTLTSHGFATNDVINVRGATQSQYNGDFKITVTGANTFTYDITGSPASPATGTIIVNDGPVVQSSYGSGIYATGVYSSPSIDNGREYIVLAGGAKAYFWRDGSKPFAKNYPTSADELIEDSDEVSVLQAFDRLYILRKAPRFGLEKDISSITSVSTTATVTCIGHGFQSGQSVRISGAEPSGYNGTYSITFVDANTFTYTLAASIPTAATGDMTAEGATAYGPKSVTSGGITVSGTTATVNCTAHGIPVGATVRLQGSTVPAFDGIEYAVATAATDSFTVTVPTGTATDSTTTGRTVTRVKPPLYYDGGSGDFVRAARGIPAEGVSFRRMQSVGWGAYINNRVWLPDGKDSVMISDVLDPDLFDPFFNSFRANEGSSDYIVGIHPWVDGQALVFLRNSIWLAALNDFSSTNGEAFEVDSPVSKLQLLTDEVGCVARRSIATAGQYVYFLSDAGVYRLDARLDLKLRGDTRPLSDSISDQFDGISGEAASRAVGKWFNNRYWLSVPSGSIDDPYNLYIYSALNEQWETRDVYNFPIEDLLVALYNRERRLFASSRNGRLFLLDELEAGDQGEAGSELTPVSASMRTRRYSMNTLRSKRFVRAVADALLPHQASMRLRASTINPDGVSTILTQANNSGDDEDYTLKGPIRLKANYLDIIAESINGRPSLRAMSVEAALQEPQGTAAVTRS